MARAPDRVAALLAGALACGCGGLPEGECVFASPVLLAEVLETPDARAPGNECEFEITDAEGRPVPHALLRLDWPEAGRIAIQTSSVGRLSLRFCDELELAGATLRAEMKPIGQDVLAVPYEEATSAVPGARIVLRVRSHSEESGAR